MLQCCRAIAGAGSGKAELSSADCSLLTSLLRWPAPQLFPAYDIARLVALDSEGAQHLATSAGTLGQGSSGLINSLMHQLWSFSGVFCFADVTSCPCAGRASRSSLKLILQTCTR